MRKANALIAVCLALLGLSASAQDTPNHFVLNQVRLPHSQVVTDIEPACGGGTPQSTQDVLNQIGKVLDVAFIGAPLVSALVKDNSALALNVEKVLGLHVDHKATCQVMCVVIPENARITDEDACIRDDNKRCAMVKGHNDIHIDYWGGTRAQQSVIKDGKQVVCVVAKNWSHTKDRDVSWRVWYRSTP